MHHHYSGAIYAEDYLDWVGKKNYCVYLEDHVEKGSDPSQHRYFKKYQIERREFATLPKPVQDICVSAKDIFTSNSLADFYRGLLMKWSDKDYENHYHEQPAPDQQFFATFGYFGGVSDYDYHAGLQSLKERAKAENVQYLETMLKGAPTVEDADLDKKLNALNAQSSDAERADAFTAYANFMAGDAKANAQIETYVQSVEEAAANLDDADFKLRFQSYVSRGSTPAKVFSGLYSAFAASNVSPLIVGVNIVGPENGYVAMCDYSLHMHMFQFLKQRFPKVKLALHAGELTLGMVPPEGLKNHIREAVQIAGANRIGHGVDVSYESDPDQLLALLKARNVAIEVNLTSNAVILGVKNEEHPIQLYRNYGVPFVISTDDAGVSRNNLSGEYMLFISRYKPSYIELKKVVYNSIRYSFLSDGEKAEQIKVLDQRFARFEARVVTLVRARRPVVAHGRVGA
ncbi:adenosine deaminase family protein [Andreprevotia chitinilytica]|uniref:adenosine deaminase family protein n=1 Tax=Andreprevotia chitinilytica TaxID=396808 RepID=UPI00147028DD|nr:adenosine deaminase [Andreprevotia chitinilytica]